LLVEKIAFVFACAFLDSVWGDWFVLSA